MKRVRWRVAVSVLAAFTFVACGVAPQPRVLAGAAGDYLGQAPPGEEMTIFAEGLISFGLHEHHLTISPDGSEMFYVVADRYRKHHAIIQLSRRGDQWLAPQVAPFSGMHNDFAPTFAPDGQTLYFCSSRPLPGAGEERSDSNIWVVVRNEDGWAEPVALPFPINDESREYNPSITSDGSLYFQDHDESGVDIYYSRYADDTYLPPVKVEAVSSPHAEIGPYVTPDESMLLFSSDRPGGLGSYDFYVSFRTAEGAWSRPVNLGQRINTPTADAIVSLSPDGRYLFFTNFLGLDPEALKAVPYTELIRLLRSPQNGDGTIYWIAASILEDARQAAE